MSALLCLCRDLLDEVNASCLSSLVGFPHLGRDGCSFLSSYPSVMGSGSSPVGPGTHCSEHLHFTGQTGSYLGHLDLSTFLSLIQGTRDLDLDKVQICVSVFVLASQERQGPKLIPEFFSSSARPKLIFKVTYN